MFISSILEPTSAELFIYILNISKLEWFQRNLLSFMTLYEPSNPRSPE